MAAPVVYRQLLRLARELDRNPMSKALIVAGPEQLFDRRRRAVIELPQVEGALAECGKLLGQFNAGVTGRTAEFYAPSRSAVEAVLQSRHAALTNNPIDVGLAALRALGVAAQGGEALRGLQPTEPWPPLDNAVRLRPATTPRVGSLLLTHPVSCLAQPSLHHACILLLSVDDEHVLGVTVNKPYAQLNPASDQLPVLGAAVDSAHREGLGALRDAELHQGGDVAPTSLLTLHSLGALTDSRQVGDGLWVTANLAEVRAALEGLPAQQPVPLGRLKCVVGHAGWAREQLAAELARNVWFLLEPHEGSSLASFALMRPPAALPVGAAASAAPAGASAWLRDAMWAGAMQRAGGEYLELGGFPGDHAAVRAQMAEVEALQRELLQRRLDLFDRAHGSGGDGGGGGGRDDGSGGG